MSRMALLATACVAVALAGCYRDPVDKAKPGATVERANYRAVSRLDCPEEQGDLARTAAAEDGRSCDYRAPDGTLVTLKLIELSNGDGAAALAPLETELRALMPSDIGRNQATAGPNTATVVAGPATITSNDEDAHIRMPGVSIDADDDGAQVRIGGLHIDADDNGADIVVRRKVKLDGEVVVEDADEKVNISAGDTGAVIRTQDNGPGFRSTFILAADEANPYHVVGYDARGPSDGPLVVGVVKTPQDDHDNAFADVRRLVRRQFN